MKWSQLKICATPQSKREIEALGERLPDNVDIVEGEEAKEIEYIVCSPANWPVHPAMFLTNSTGRCCECDMAIMFRPGVPKGKRMICVPCIARVTNDPQLLKLTELREGRA